MHPQKAAPCSRIAETRAGHWRRWSLRCPICTDAILLALPRGGVPVAYEVACACNLPLDVLMVRKLGAPGQRELAIGASGQRRHCQPQSRVIGAFHISPEELRAAVAARAAGEIARRELALSRRRTAARDRRPHRHFGRRRSGNRRHHARGCARRASPRRPCE